MIQNLPRDHTLLRDEEEDVLKSLYDRFDASSDAVDGQVLHIDVAGTVRQARSVMQSEVMRSYIYRLDPHDRWAPTLRAALRLGKTGDLETIDKLFQAFRKSFTPTNHDISRDELIAVCGDEITLRRMALLLGNESLASMRNLLAGGMQVYISEDILEWPTLRDYLLRNVRFASRDLAPGVNGALPRAFVTLSRLNVTNFRSIERASLTEIGPLTVLAGPNNAGKSNLMRALRLASRVATAGGPQAIEEEGGPKTIFRQQTPRTGQLVLDLGLKIRSSVQPAIDGHYEIALSREHRRPIVRETVGRAGTEFVAQNGSDAKILNELVGAQEDQYLAPNDTALSTLRDPNRHRTAIGIREGLAAWCFFNFEAGAIRQGSSLLGLPRPQHRFPLAPDGTNLPLALSELGRDDPDALRSIAKTFADYVPGTELGVGYPLRGDPVVALQEEGLTDPLSHTDMSDGMLRLLAIAYIALHPDPPSLVCIEEPENALYPRLVEAALDLLRTLSRRSQVIITTHSVTLLNLLSPDEVVFVRRINGMTELTRLSSRADVISCMATFGLGDQIRMGAVEGEG